MLLSCNYNNAQEIQNSYNLDVARELGLCYGDKKLMPGGGDFLLYLSQFYIKIQVT